MGARRVVPRLRRTDRLVVGSIDAAAHVLQRRARDVLLGAGLFMLPMVALNLVLSVLAFRHFDSFSGIFAERGYVGVETGAAFMALVVQSFTAHLIGAYAAVYLVRYQLGGDPTIRQCAGVVVRRLPLLLVTWVLTHWWAMLVVLGALSYPGVAALMIMLLVPIVGLLDTLVVFAVPAMMTERLGVASVRRGYRLARLRFGAVWGFVNLSSLIATVLFLFIGFLPTLAQSTHLITFGPYGWLVQGVALELALLVVVPFSALATAECYLQVRVHAEGIDIAMAADRAFGPAA